MSREAAMRCSLVAGACLFVLLFSDMALAQQKIEVGGKMACTITDEKQFNVGDAEGHTLMLHQSTGENKSTGAGAYMDSASVVNDAIGDLVKGNGPQFGYIMFAKGPDTTYAKWEHETTTIISPEGKPLTKFKGTFHFTAGTGQYKGIDGGGGFTGEFTSATAYAVTWQGQYALQK